MENQFKWILGMVAFCAVTVYVYSASNDFTDRWTIKNDSGTSVAYIDSSNNMTLTGNLGVGGTLAVTGASSFTGTVSAATSTIRVFISSAPRTMITPGGIGQLVWNTTDNQLCVATASVLGSFVLATTTNTVGTVNACGH